MCGIVGIVGSKQVADRLVDGLKRLEYRGYDSAGVAILENGKITRRRALGKLVNLEKLLQEQPVSGTAGIGHTRWATHGAPSEMNAHPHASAKVSLVHNGIIENHELLRERLKAEGVTFSTETDTEVIVHLITKFLNQGLTPLEATKITVSQLEGAYALAIIFEGHQDLMIGTRFGCPLVVGSGAEEMYLGSDSLALSSLTNKVAYLDEGDIVVLTPTSCVIYDKSDKVVERPLKESSVYHMPVDKGAYRHFMEKEIYEQPDVLRQTLSHYLPKIDDATLLKDLPDIKSLSTITIIACGTAYYAAFVAKYWFEKIARIPVELDIASEFRYRMPPLQKNGLTIVVSQSGETADTLAALRYAKDQGNITLSIVNAPDSSIDRESDYSFYTYAGREIGVASTKAFTTQLSALASLVFACAEAKDILKPEDRKLLREDLARAPELMTQAFKIKPQIEEIARTLSHAHDVLYLGRGYQYPIALEGALKLKEISYIHAEGYAAGELKHGPIALVDEDVPVVVCAPYDEVFEKTASNIEEVLSRKGKVIAFTDTRGFQKLKNANGQLTKVILPSTGVFTGPIVYALPMQLLAYHTATFKGTDVDQPRNLAKSVTVE